MEAMLDQHQTNEMSVLTGATDIIHLNNGSIQAMTFHPQQLKRNKMDGKVNPFG